MRFVPILLLSAALLVIVMVMTGDRTKGMQLARNIILVVVGLIAMAALFALIGNART